MKKSLFLLILFTAFIAIAAAKEPVYVDIAATNQSIAELQAEIDAATRQNSDLTNENASLEQDNQKEMDRIAEAQKLIDELGVSRGELYGARNKTNDMDQKKRVAEQLDTNMAQEHQLQLLIDRFNGNINSNNIKMTANRKQIARNNLTIRENNDQIAYLQACIDLTSNNENSLDSIFSKQDSNSSAFDSFVNANKE